MNSTFPLNQALYFDFSHDVNIAGVLTAFGLTQFAPFFNYTSINASRPMVVSRMEPFGSRLDIEMINTPHPVVANRTLSSNSTTIYTSGNATTYVHFILNQRTIPLGASYSGCGIRTDGWCELTAFLNATSNLLATSNYNYACNASYAAPAYGAITNGAITA